MRQLRKVLTAATAALIAVGGSLVVADQARAAAGCRVDYTVTNQWPGGFGADVRVTNLGDPVTGWEVRFSFGAGQTVSQLWNGSVSQSGAAVSVRDAGWNASLATGGTTSFGFNGTYGGTNPAPTAFTLYGVACTGSPASPTSTPTTSPSPTVTATRTPTPTPTPTTGPGTGGAAQLVADLGKGWNLGNQLEALEPFRALPGIQPRHHQANGTAMIGIERCAVVSIRQQHIVGEQIDSGRLVVQPSS